MIKRFLLLLSIFVFLLGGVCSSETASLGKSEPSASAAEIQKERKKPEAEPRVELKDSGTMASSQRDRLDELAAPLVDEDPIETIALRGGRANFSKRAGLTLRRETVVVKFRAHSGKIMGGLYKSVKLVLSDDDDF